MSKYKCIKQHEPTECGAACITTICLRHKKKTSIVKLRDMFGADIEGANAIELANILDLLGFDAKVWKGNKEALEEQKVLPCIVSVSVNGRNQFVVIHKIDKKQMIIADPSIGTRKISKEEFYKIFTGDIILCSPRKDFVKSKRKKRRATKGLSKLLFRQKKLITLAVISSVLLTLFGVLGSLFSKYLIDELLPYNINNQLLIFCVGLGVIGLFSILLQAIRQHILLFLSMKIDIPLMLGYFKHIFTLPMKNYETRRTGDVLTRVQDASSINDVYATISLSLVIDVLLAFAIAILLFFMNKILFLVVISIAIVNIIVTCVFKGKYKKLSYKTIASKSALNSKFVESLNQIETIKSFGIENETYHNLERRYMQNVKNTYTTSVLSNVQGNIKKVICIISVLLLMFFGGSLVEQGEMTYGALFAFAALSYFFLDPMTRLVSLQQQLQETKSAKKRMNTFYELNTEESGDITDEVSLNGDIVIENLTFKHNNRREVLKDINITFENKSKIAIVGSSASGKSTIAKILLGLWSYEEGNIKINDVELKEICKKTLRNKVAYVPQNIELFSGSIMDNIKVGNPNATLEDVQIACTIAGCNPIINKLPSGLDSYVEENGYNLSGGEKQRIALARAIIKKPELLIIDEATSNLDLVSESIILNNICNLDTTVIFITHRLATVKNMEKIIVLNNTILEQGTHDELLANENAYYRLWNSQVGEGELLDIKETMAEAIVLYNEKEEKLKEVNEEKTNDNVEEEKQDSSDDSTFTTEDTVVYKEENNKEENNEEIKDSKEESKEEVKEESKEEIKEEIKEESNEDVKDSKVETKEKNVDVKKIKDSNIEDLMNSEKTIDDTLKKFTANNEPLKFDDFDIISNQK